MNFLPKEIEDIIMEYKCELEVVDNKKILNKEFKSTYCYYISDKGFMGDIESRRFNKKTGEMIRMSKVKFTHDEFLRIQDNIKIVYI